MEQILVGANDKKQEKLLLLSMANRHGLIAGATGTGKTVSLQTLAEQFSLRGVPVFTADVKGDLSGIAMPRDPNPKIDAILKKYNLKKEPRGNPVIFWDVYGKTGIPLRATLTELGPLLLGRLLETNETQQGIINSAFSYADDQGLLVLDIKDFRSLLNYMSDQADSLQAKYGNISKNTIGVLQRGLLTLSEAGGDNFFGEPAVKLSDLMRVDNEGHGYINVLDATKLIHDPRIYCTFLLWLLSELFEQLPEVGDVDKPKLVFFFDEAHLLFDSAPKVLLDKIEQVVRLIRSKGVGVYFVSQNPLDIPEDVLGQLGNRMQHALRAFTPKDQKAVKVAAQTFRQNPKLNTATVITELKVGEALVSFLDQDGMPEIVEKINVFPPASKIGTISEEQRKLIVKNSPCYGMYEQAIDRESAYEILSKRKNIELKPFNLPKTKTRGRPSKQYKSPSSSDILLDTTSSVLNSRIGKQILRGVLGSIFGGKK